MYGSPYFATRFAYVSLLQKYFAINCLSSIRLKSSMTFFVTVLIDSTLFKNISITSIKAVEYLAKNKKKMTSGSAQRKPLPGGYHLLLSYYLAVRLRVSPRDFHPHLSIFLEKDEPWMSRTSKPNNFVAWSQPVGFPLLLIIRFAKSAETKKREGMNWGHILANVTADHVLQFGFSKFPLFPLHKGICRICENKRKTGGSPFNH